MKLYRRLKQHLNSVGTLIPKDEDIFKYVTDQNTDWYYSAFYYNEEQKKQIEENKSFKNITGVVTNRLWWDFDSNVNIESSRQDAIKLVERLIENKIQANDIQIYFSGNKGFHVIIEHDQFLNQAQVQDICIKKMGSDLPSLDLSIYDEARVLRLEKTKHNKNNSYKKPMTINGLKNRSIDEILEWSKIPEFKNLHHNLITIPNEWIVPTETKKEKLNNELDNSNNYQEQIQNLSGFDQLQKMIDLNIINLEKINFKAKPKYFKDYKWALLQGYFPDGERHSALIVLAATLRGMGYDRESTYYLCQSAIEKQAKLTGKDKFGQDELWENVINDTVFSSHWNGGQYSIKNNAWLQKYCKIMGFTSDGSSEEEEHLKTYNIGEVHTFFKNYSDHIDEMTIKFGIPALDKYLRATIGMTVGMVGSPGSGKTSLLISALNYMSKTGEQCIFFSYDMYHAIIYQKLIQKHFNLNSDEIFLKLNGYKILYKEDYEAQHYLKEGRKIISENEWTIKFDFSEAKDIEFENKIREMLDKEYKNVEFCFTAGQSVDDIGATIMAVEEKTGKKVKFIGVDYNELVKTDERLEATASSNLVAQKLREISLIYNLCTFELFQPSKMTGDPSDEITSYRAAKGGSGIEQSVAIMLSMSRPGYNPLDNSMDKFARISCLKNRMGPLFKVDLHFNGLTGNFRNLSNQEIEELKNLLDSHNDDDDNNYNRRRNNRSESNVNAPQETRRNGDEW